MIGDPKPRTFRSKPFRKYVEQQPCEVRDGNCKGDVVAAHTGRGGERIKAPDSTCIPLCFHHHTEQHTMGYKTFADRYALDYPRICIRLLEGFIDERLLA